MRTPTDGFQSFSNINAFDAFWTFLHKNKAQRQEAAGSLSEKMVRESYSLVDHSRGWVGGSCSEERRLHLVTGVIGYTTFVPISEKVGPERPKRLDSRRNIIH